jgi:hypothetical protein
MPEGVVFLEVIVFWEVFHVVWWKLPGSIRVPAPPIFRIML